MGHINIRSIPQHYDELCLLPLHQFDILCFSETWLNHNHSDESIELTFFADPLRHDRTDPNKQHGGGSAIYYKLGLECTQMTELESMFDKDIDSVWIKVKTESKSIIIGTIYKPPHADSARFMSSLGGILLHPSTTQYDVILTGDFNINWYKDSLEKIHFTSLLTNFSLKQLIDGTTHVGLTHESCIDLICIPSHVRTNHHGIIFNHMHNGITWHNFTSVSINTTPTRAPRKIVNKRNFKNFNAQHFISDASYIIPFYISPPNNSADDLANDLENKINELVDKHAPFKCVRVRPTRKPWITAELVKLISQKNRMFKNCRKNQAQWGEYKEFRNFVLLQIRQAKKCYYKALIDNSKPRDKWAVLNKIADKRKKSQDIAILNYENTTVTSQSEIANTLNKFISEIGSTINKDLTKVVPYNTTTLNSNPNGFKVECPTVWSTQRQIRPFLHMY